MTKQEFIQRYGEEKYFAQLRKQKDNYHQRANYLGDYNTIQVYYLTSNQKITVDNFELLSLKERAIEKRVS